MGFASHFLVEPVGSRDNCLALKVKRPYHTLSDREYAIMLRIVAGDSLKKIGRQFTLSPKTISTYRARILEKLLVTSNVQLAQFVLTHVDTSNDTSPVTSAIPGSSRFLP